MAVSRRDAEDRRTDGRLSPNPADWLTSFLFLKNVLFVRCQVCLSSAMIDICLRLNALALLITVG